MDCGVWDQMAAVLMHSLIVKNNDSLIKYTIMNAMSKPVRKCPGCGVPLTCQEISAGGSFPCPACKTLLQASEYYAISTLLASLLLCAVVFAALGFRGLRLLYALLLALVPVIYLAANYFKYLIPPKIEYYVPRNTDLSLPK
jgi:hypothetical protein